MPERIEIIEVGSRDGLQNEPTIVPIEAKLAFISGLIAAGVTDVEATSFVSPKAVPQLADADELLGVLPRHPGVRIHALVPNERGYDRAIAAKVDVVALFTSATEAFCQANISCSIEESFHRFAPVIERAKSDGRRVRGYLSVAFVCPFTGNVNPDAVAELATRLAAIGCDDVCLADTVGLASPDQIAAVFERLIGPIPVKQLSLHVHDTNGRAIDNIGAAIDLGIRRFDSAAGGLGGCPFAPGAPGNVATETVLRYLHGRGFETGIDPNRLIRALDAVRPYVPRLAVH